MPGHATRSLIHVSNPSSAPSSPSHAPCQQDSDIPASQPANQPATLSSRHRPAQSSPSLVLSSFHGHLLPTYLHRPSLRWLLNWRHHSFEEGTNSRHQQTARHGATLPEQKTTRAIRLVLLLLLLGERLLSVCLRKPRMPQLAGWLGYFIFRIRIRVLPFAFSQSRIVGEGMSQESKVDVRACVRREGQGLGRVRFGRGGEG